MIIGITGGIASGKSLVSNMIKELGYHVLDADCIARKIVNKGSEVYYEIVAEFGESILDLHGEIDRQQLAAIIFTDEKARTKLNQITHPPIRKKIMEDAAIVEKSEGVVFLDIPLLFETGYDRTIDKTIVVYTSLPIQVERLMNRDSIDDIYARKKISSQMPLEKKKLAADFVIDNNGTTLSTQKQVERMLQVIIEGE